MKPIDYVVPMVFTDDASWRQQWADTMGWAGDNANNSPHWRSWGTEEYSIRLVLKNMPWIRTIYILLFDKNQVQPWMERLMEETDKICLVFHAAFIPEEFSPVFNSCTIEMFLHRIPGLAEQFIYGNDDLFPLAPLQPTDFFRKGKPCLHFDEIPYKESRSASNIIMSARKHELGLISADFGRQFGDVILDGGHSMVPMLLSTVRKVWDLHGDGIVGSITSDRSARNLSQYIYSYYQYLSGRYNDYTPLHSYSSPSGNADLFTAVFNPDAGILCINDTGLANGQVGKLSNLTREALGIRMEQTNNEDNGEGTNDSAAVD